MEELLEDYRDYLRARDLPVWDKDGLRERMTRARLQSREQQRNGRGKE